MQLFRNFFLLIVVCSSPCFAINESVLIEAIEQQNISEVMNFFEEIETITWDEAQELITRFYDHYLCTGQKMS